MSSIAVLGGLAAPEASLLKTWAVICTLLAAAALARSWRGVRGTTLLAPWLWSWWALAVVAAVELAAAFAASPASVGDPTRYAAMVCTFGPIIAILGAKRPQDRAWQFIVLSLLVVLAVPAIQSWVMRGVAPVSLHAAWAGFLLLLVAVGLFNTLPTRFWLSAILYSSGQVLLLAAYVPWITLPLPEWHASVGFALCVAAVALAAFWPARQAAPAGSLTRLWIDFRNAVGAVWGLRIAERFNATSQANGWNVTLTWYGFHAGSATGPMTEEIPPEARELVRTLLRRFVSVEWIAARWREA